MRCVSVNGYTNYADFFVLQFIMAVNIFSTLQFDRLYARLFYETISYLRIFYGENSYENKK